MGIVELYAISYGNNHYSFKKPFEITETIKQDGGVVLIVSRYQFLNAVGNDRKSAFENLAKKIHYALVSTALDVEHANVYSN